MARDLFRKFLSVALLVFLVFLLFSSESILWPLYLSKWTGLYPARLETREIGSFSSGRDPPISLGAMKDRARIYLNLRLIFSVDSALPYPNLFQTADANSGVRLEISGTTAAIVFRSDSEAAGVRVLILSTDLKEGQQYGLQVEALNGSFLRARLDNGPRKTYTSSDLSFDVSNVKIGDGFDNTRPFVGSISKISLSIGSFEPGLYNRIHIALRFLELVTMLLFSFTLVRAFPGFIPLTRRIFSLLILLQRRYRIFGGPWTLSSSRNVQ
jgi:hypothetical protein